MKEHLKNEGDPPGKGSNFGNKNKFDARILGLNMLILAAYTIVSKLTEGGIILDAFFIIFHLFGCVVIGGVQRSWTWVLSGLLVLIIGFATCIEVAGR